MSNKTLAYLLLAIVVLLAGGFLTWRLTVGNQSAEIKQENQTSPTNETTNMDNSTAPSSGSESCQRAFDENILKTAKVDIKNRQAEISVKGFGNIIVEFYDQDAPRTVENFLRLANSGYYNCVTFHRVAKGFVIQGGDPTGTGRGGDSAFGSKFEDELNPNTPSYQAGYKKGVLAMANSGPDTNSSQFFIMLEDVPLNNAYTIFGKVIAGQDVVDRIGQVDIVPQMGPEDCAPVTPVVMESVKIIK